MGKHSSRSSTRPWHRMVDRVSRHVRAVGAPRRVARVRTLPARQSHHASHEHPRGVGRPLSKGRTRTQAAPRCPGRRPGPSDGPRARGGGTASNGAGRSRARTEPGRLPRIRGVKTNGAAILDGRPRLPWATPSRARARLAAMDPSRSHDRPILRHAAACRVGVSPESAANNRLTIQSTSKGIWSS